MEYSLTKPNGDKMQFKNLLVLLRFIQMAGEIDGWVIRVHHM